MYSYSSYKEPYLSNCFEIIRVSSFDGHFLKLYLQLDENYHLIQYYDKLPSLRNYNIIIHRSKRLVLGLFKACYKSEN